jgi:hypothetical protein
MPEIPAPQMTTSAVDMSDSDLIMLIALVPEGGKRS